VLNDSDSKPVSSAGLLAQGPLVVSFYRGVWCPYCNMELQTLQEALPAFRKMGGTSWRSRRKPPPTAASRGAPTVLIFLILSDLGNETAGAFELRFALPDYLIKLYKNFKNDLPAFNGDRSWTLPMPGSLRGEPGQRHSLRQGQPRLHTPPRARGCAGGSPQSATPHRVAWRMPALRSRLQSYEDETSTRPASQRLTRRVRQSDYWASYHSADRGGIQITNIVATLAPIW